MHHFRVIYLRKHITPQEQSRSVPVRPCCQMNWRHFVIRNIQTTFRPVEKLAEDGGAHSCSGSVLSLLVLSTNMCTCFVSGSCCVKNNYSRHDLQKFGVCSKQSVSSDFLCSHNIPLDIVRCPGSPGITIPAGRRRRRLRERKEKQGCRARALARLRREPLKQPLPSIFHQHKIAD